MTRSSLPTVGPMFVLGFSALLVGERALANGTAWLAEPGSGYTSLSFVMQTADEYYRSKSRGATPRGADLSQGTLWLTTNYAVSDSWAVDATVGWARSDFLVAPMIPTTMANFTGLVDTKVGVTWRVNDELSSDHPSVALRCGAVLAGDYETGHINSLGDGANGYEASVIVGEFVNDRLGLQAEVGFRWRGNKVPNESFATVSGVWLLGENLSLGLDYRLVDAQSGLDIGGTGFSPPRFPEVEEDIEMISGSLYYAVNERFSFSIFHAAVVDGRNTPHSTVYGGAVSYTFGTY